MCNIHMFIKHCSTYIEKVKGNEKVGLMLSFLHCSLSPVGNIIIESKSPSSWVIEADYIGRLQSGFDALNKVKNWSGELNT